MNFVFLNIYTNHLQNQLKRDQLKATNNKYSDSHTLLSISLQLIWDWTMYMTESTNPVHSLIFLLASLRSELTFLFIKEKKKSSHKLIKK